MRKEERQTIPMMIFRDLVMMPETSVHIDIQREDSLKAVQHAMNENLDLFVVTAKDVALGDTFTTEDLYDVGTVVKVKQMLKLPKNVVRVMLLGQRRAKLKSILTENVPCYMAEISTYETQKESLSATENKAYVRTVKELIDQCESNSILTSDTVVKTLKRVRIMNIKLGNLKEGTWRDVTEQEWEELQEMIRYSSNTTVLSEK